MSARSGTQTFDLRCEVRELIDFLQKSIRSASALAAISFEGSESPMMGRIVRTAAVAALQNLQNSKTSKPMLQCMLLSERPTPIVPRNSSARAESHNFGRSC